MAPPHGYFPNAQAVTAANEEYFRIESKTHDGQLVKCRQRLLAVKQFEPALSIVNPQTEQQPDHPIEDDAADFPEWRLMLVNEASIDGARADHDIGVSAHCNFEKFFQFFDWRRQVRVRKKNINTLGRKHTLTHGMAFAVVFRVTENSQARNLSLTDQVRGAVRGSVVDDDDLRLKRSLPHKVLNLPDGNADPRGLIKGRNNDGDHGTFVYHTVFGLIKNE